MSEPDRYRDLLADRLRALVAERGTSVMWVEKQIGRGRGYVADALRGYKKLAVEVILDVLEVLGVPPEEFFAGTAPRSAALVDPVAKDNRSAVRTRRRARRSSPLVEAVLLLLAQKGVSQGELHEIERAIDERLRGQAPPSPPSRVAKR